MKILRKGPYVDKKKCDEEETNLKKYRDSNDQKWLEIMGKIRAQTFIIITKTIPVLNINQ